MTENKDPGIGKTLTNIPNLFPVERIISDSKEKKSENTGTRLYSEEEQMNISDTSSVKVVILQSEEKKSGTNLDSDGARINASDSSSVTVIIPENTVIPDSEVKKSETNPHPESVNLSDTSSVPLLIVESQGRQFIVTKTQEQLEKAKLQDKWDSKRVNRILMSGIIQSILASAFFTELVYGIQFDIESTGGPSSWTLFLLNIAVMLYLFSPYMSGLVNKDTLKAKLIFRLVWLSHATMRISVGFTVYCGMLFGVEREVFRMIVFTGLNYAITSAAYARYKQHVALVLSKFKSDLNQRIKNKINQEIIVERY